jgi:hypothetical protein
MYVCGNNKNRTEVHDGSRSGINSVKVIQFKNLISHIPYKTPKISIYETCFSYGA